MAQHYKTDMPIIDIKMNALKPMFSAETNTTLTFGNEKLDAVCVDYINLGVKDTPYGRKEQVKFVFETPNTNDNGYPDKVSKTFTKSLHELSSLRPFLESWLGRKLSEAEVPGFRLQSMAGKPCVLEVQDAVSSKGFAYLKLINIFPAGATKLKPSGLYRRFEPSTK